MKYILILAALFTLSSCTSNTETAKSNGDSSDVLERIVVETFRYETFRNKVVKKEILTSSYNSGGLEFSFRESVKYFYSDAGTLEREVESKLDSSRSSKIKEIFYYQDSTIEYTYEGKVKSGYTKKYKNKLGLVSRVEVLYPPDINETVLYKYKQGRLVAKEILEPNGKKINYFTFRRDSTGNISKEVTINHGQNIEITEKRFYENNKIYLKTNTIPGEILDSFIYKNNKMVKYISDQVGMGSKVVEFYKYDKNNRLIEKKVHFINKSLQ